MTAHDLIFSNSGRYRRYRHLLFWSARFLMLLCVIGSGIAIFSGMAIGDGFRAAIFPSLYLAAVECAFTIFIVYALIPRYRSEKIILFATCSAITFFLFLIAASPAYIRWMALQDIPVFSFQLFWRLFLACSSWSFPVIAFFIALHFFRLYHLRALEQTRLQNENALAEMQLLKAQIHPHFLFNTLNNIYSFTLSHHPQSANLTAKLTDIFKYMIDHCNEESIPLDAELKMINDYLELEKIRYGERLSLEYQVTGSTEMVAVTPLLLLPFIENSFKHGAAKSWQPCWIKINIAVENQLLALHVSNSIPQESGIEKEMQGIGQENVRKRLALLFPSESWLNLEQTKDQYRVEMTVPVTNAARKNIPAKKFRS